MCRFLTGASRLQQTKKKRVWKLLDNEVFKANDGTIYIAPRTFQSDNFTIPLFLAWLTGSPVDFDTRCSHIHDVFCSTHYALVIKLSEEELKDKGYLRYSEKNKMWICEDIPPEFISKKKIGKFKANNIFYECMEVSGVPKFYRVLYRIGVALNLNWFISVLFKKVVNPDLNKIYTDSYWDSLL